MPRNGFAPNPSDRSVEERDEENASIHLSATDSTQPGYPPFRSLSMQHTNYLNALNEIPLRIALLKIKVGDGVVDSLESRLFVVVENSSIPVQDGHALIHGRMTTLRKRKYKINIKGSCRSWKKIVKVWMKEKLDVSFGQQLLGLHVLAAKFSKCKSKPQNSSQNVVCHDQNTC